MTNVPPLAAFCSTIRLLCAVGLGALLLLIWPGTTFADDAGYRVGSQDRLRIRVSEWRPNSRDLFEWSALSNEFVVDASGALSLPIIGTLAVRDRTTDQIASLISERLKTTAGLVNPPATAVEIVQYRPIYVVGAVERAGEYPFRPAMTVLQAISIAGGFQRSELTLGRFERDTIAAEGEIRVQQAQLSALLLRRDRLAAEAAGDTQLTFTEEAVRFAGGEGSEALQEERGLFSSRTQAVRSQRELLRQARTLLDEENGMLAAKTITQQRQQELIRRELANINALLSKGLAVSPRQLAVEQNLAQSESQALDLMLAAARVRQDISRTDRSLADLDNQRAIEIGRELRETQTVLVQVKAKISSLRLLVHESSSIAPALQDRKERALAQMRLSILRRQAASVTEFPADEATDLRPGDVLKIERAPIALFSASPENPQARAQN